MKYSFTLLVEGDDTREKRVLESRAGESARPDEKTFDDLFIISR